MSVIGRLDGQVEEVLIKPAGRRGRAGEPIPAGPADAHGRPAPGEPDAAGAAAEDGRAQTPHEQERARRPDAIPVWLL